MINGYVSNVQVFVEGSDVICRNLNGDVLAVLREPSTQDLVQKSIEKLLTRTCYRLRVMLNGCLVSQLDTWQDLMSEPSRKRQRL